MRGAFFVWALLGGCAAVPHPPAPAKDAGAPTIELVKPFGVPGEEMHYSAALRGLPVGKLVTAVGKLGWVEGRKAIIVKSRGQSTGMIALLAELTYELTTTIDLDRGHVIDSREESWAVFAGEKEHELSTIGDDGRHDVHSAAAAVRAWRSLPGQTGQLRVDVGSSTVDVHLRDAGRGFLVSAGEPAVRYEGLVEDRIKVTAWVSDDTARVPLRFECDIPTFGQLVIDLAHYTAPAD
ncbi:MAG: DUF3108 domain-containing protein [Deltaproteobacteria bacterium]|nr:DUF3108 domain-containing protein [Deltaproteobacteria bacterium]